MQKDIRTCEFVTPGHPDKMCDVIADNILDAYMAKDTNSRCAIEIMGGHNLITVNGEVTSRAKPNIEALIKKMVGKNYKVIVNIALQSPEIAQGVDTGGAGDQGIMKGYATRETKSFMPLEYELARNLCMKLYAHYPFDGKVQVTVADGKVTVVVASFQNVPQDLLRHAVKKYIKADTYLINPAGDWNQGGFDADSGLSGRKLIIDNYGPEHTIGGGSFSGKDYTKVDRSGAYMARKIAVDMLKKNKSYNSVEVKLAYAIGIADPVMAVAVIDGKKEIAIEGYDLSPRGIYKKLKFDSVKFADTCTWGHFGRSFPWDK